MPGNSVVISDKSQIIPIRKDCLFALVSVMINHVTFTSIVTGNMYRINHQFNCSEKCLVCLLTCNKSLKQYVGQTLDKLCQWWNNYKSNDWKFQRLQPYMQEHLFSHFSMAGHNRFLNSVSLTFIDKTDLSIPLRREYYLKL